MPLALCHGLVAKGFFVMKTQVSPAIIMRVREIRESDLLVIFFARDKGPASRGGQGSQAEPQALCELL